MRKFSTCALIAAMIVLALPAAAVHPSQLDSMSWWGNTGATPEPVPDPHKGRSGYWWWPTEPASNAGDSELWGNRGIVYYRYERPAPAPVPTPPPPTPAPPTVVDRRPVDNTVLFEFDKATLSPEGRAALDEIVAELKRFPNDTITVEGHTCNVGSAQYNMGLSERRANAVVNYLVSQGIDRGRIKAEWYGLTRPAVPNDTPANRKLNRRAYFTTVVNQ